MIIPEAKLRAATLEFLRPLCLAVGISHEGNKPEIVQRLVDFFLSKEGQERQQQQEEESDLLGKLARTVAEFPLDEVADEVSRFPFDSIADAVENVLTTNDLLQDIQRKLDVLTAAVEGTNVKLDAAVEGTNAKLDALDARMEVLTRALVAPTPRPVVTAESLEEFRQALNAERATQACLQTQTGHVLPALCPAPAAHPNGISAPASPAAVLPHFFAYCKQEK
ncbi:hypothetical protein QOT17_007821 [Balamuthia mandrillaris]